MQCLSCSFENPDGMRFCGACGAALTHRCPSCDFVNPPNFRFCGSCGAALRAVADAPPPRASVSVPPAPASGAPSNAEPQGDSAGQRRQLTVMFCDLVGSTALSQQLDPEDLREVLLSYQLASSRVVDRFGGLIAKYLGDGLLIYFGYPIAGEDDARRAVSAGLALLAEVAGLDARLRHDRALSVAARVAVHTGLVVVGDMGTAGRPEVGAIVGETPNIAARLQERAEPNTLVISGATHHLVGPFFVCEALGSHALKGLSQPMPIYRVRAESGLRSRLDAAPTELTPIVGRTHELGVLLDRWEQSRDGFGQAVVLSGEAGIGKSRLARTLKAHAAEVPHLWLEGQGSPHHQHSALYPVIDLLEHILGITHTESSDVKRARLRAVLRQHDLDLPEREASLAALLSLASPEPSSASRASPERQRRQTLETVLLLLQRLAAAQPVVLLIEDLHWVDASTLEWLTLLLDRLPAMRLFAVLTCRPEFQPPWAFRSQIVNLTLSRLSPKQTETMVRHVARSMQLPVAVVQHVAARTDGVPLFAEELTKAVLESGVLARQADGDAVRESVASLAIPTTLQDSLLARLDRLGGARVVAQLGATVGRQFSHQLLQAVCSLDEDSLQQAIARLIDAQLLYQSGEPPQATYLFKHALVQEAAYASLLKSTRQLYHGQIAQVLAETRPDLVETEPELLAHHYSESADRARAIAYWLRAGQRATERSANAEAIGHFRRGLDVLRSLPAADDSLRQELELQAALGLVLMPTEGYGSPSVEAAYTRALDLCRQVGQTPRLFSVLRGLWELYDLRADIARASDLGRELLELASSVQDAGLQAVAYNALGETLIWSGEFDRAREHLECGIRLYDHQQHRALAFEHGGYHVGAVSRIWLAHALWYLGLPDQALQWRQEALDLAREMAHPHTMAFTLTQAAVFHQARGEARAVQAHADAAIALATDQGFVFWVAYGRILRGWAAAELGQADTGIGEIQAGLASYRASGSILEMPLWLAILADAHRRLGQTEAALEAIGDALEISTRTGVRVIDAELHRLTGELLLDGPAPDVERAARCFQEALRSARRRAARSLELRAATSLARLWQRQGRANEGADLLAGVYNGFTEGFATPDLGAARALLTALSAP